LVSCFCDGPLTATLSMLAKARVVVLERGRKEGKGRERRWHLESRIWVKWCLEPNKYEGEWVTVSG